MLHIKSYFTYYVLLAFLITNTSNTTTPSSVKIVPVPSSVKIVPVALAGFCVWLTYKRENSLPRKILFGICSASFGSFAAASLAEKLNMDCIEKLDCKRKAEFKDLLHRIENLDCERKAELKNLLCVEKPDCEHKAELKDLKKN